MLSQLVNSTLGKLSTKALKSSNSPENLYPTPSFPSYSGEIGRRLICARCLTLLFHMMKQYGDGTRFDGLQITHSSSIRGPDFPPKHPSIWSIFQDENPKENFSSTEPSCVICAKTKILVDAMQGHVSFEDSLRKTPYNDWSLSWAGDRETPHNCLSVLITARHKGGYGWGIGGFKVYPNETTKNVPNSDSKKYTGDYPVIVSLYPETHTKDNIDLSSELDFSSTLSTGTIAEVQKWAQICATHHAKCLRIFGNDGKDQIEPRGEWYPDRLIKIIRRGNVVARRHIAARVVLKSDPVDFPPGTKGIKYLSLSHSWGPAPNPSAPLGGRASTVLTGSNIGPWTVDLPLEDLPLTFVEAIMVCASLSFEYIWIDSLCILQDSTEDWRSQSAVMGDAYKFAWLNIAALSTKSDYDGFINDSRDPRVEFGFRAPFGSILSHEHKTRNENDQDRVLLRGKAKFVWNFCGNIPGSVAYNAPLFTRAWVYQEQNLARRTLAFSKNSVYWACDEDTHGEQPEWGGIEGSGLRRTLHVVREVAASKQSTTRLSLTKEEIESILKRYELCWQTTITSYTLCNLTKHTDKLIAVSSIARELANMMPYRYLAGLWDTNILEQLTWININGRTTSPRKRVRDTDYVAPSWSWASVEAAVQSYSIFPSVNTQIALADALASDVVLETDYAFGFVKAGWVRMRGRLNRVKATNIPFSSWGSSDKSTSLTDESTGCDMWFSGDTVEAYELIKSRKGLERLVWIPMLAFFDSTVSCQSLYLIEVHVPDQVGDDGKFVRPGEKVYRRIGSGNFGRVTTKLREDKLLLDLGSYAEIPAEAGQREGQVIAKGFKRKEDEFQEFVLI